MNFSHGFEMGLRSTRDATWECTLNPQGSASNRIQNNTKRNMQDETEGLEGLTACPAACIRESKQSESRNETKRNKTKQTSLLVVFCMVRPICAQTLGNGIASRKYQGNQTRFCSLQGLSQGEWRRLDVKRAATDPARRVPRTFDAYTPLEWVPDSCTLDSFDANHAKAVLRKTPLLLLGDSVTKFLFEEIAFGLLEDYSRPSMTIKGALSSETQLAPMIRFLRKFYWPLESAPTLVGAAARIVDELQKLPGYPSRPVLCWNWGAHMAKLERFWCTPGQSSQVSTVALNKSRNVTILRPGADWGDVWRRSACSKGASCFDDCRKVAAGSFDSWIRVMTQIRSAGFTGRMIYRTTLINFGFDKRGHENCIKIELNRMARMSQDFRALRIEILDFEAPSATRPEQFHHENTNHIHCNAPPAVYCKGYAYCASSSCVNLRGSTYDNGELSRYTAQATLHALEHWAVRGSELGQAVGFRFAAICNRTALSTINLRYARQTSS